MCLCVCLLLLLLHTYSCLCLLKVSSVLRLCPCWSDGAWRLLCSCNTTVNCMLLCVGLQMNTHISRKCTNCLAEWMDVTKLLADSTVLPVSGSSTEPASIDGARHTTSNRHAGSGPSLLGGLALVAKARHTHLGQQHAQPCADAPHSRYSSSRSQSHTPSAEQEEEGEATI